MLRKYRFITSVVLLLLAVNTAYGQEEKIIQMNLEGDTVELAAVPIMQITTQLETDYNILTELGKITEKDFEIVKFDSIYKEKLKFINDKKDIFDQKKVNYSPRDVDNKLTEWTSYYNIAIDWNELFKSKTSDIEKNFYTVQTMGKVWELTSKFTKKTKAPQSVINSVSDILKEIKKVDNHVIGIQNNLLQKQTDISKLNFTIKEVINELEDIKEQQRSEYFTLEDPIWAVSDTSVRQKTMREHFVKTFNQDANGVQIFYQSNRDRIYLHLILFLLIWVAFYFIQKQSVLLEEDENEEDLLKAKHVISRYGISSLIISLFISIWIYPEVSSAIQDIIRLIYIIIALSFIATQISQTLKPLLYGVLILFLIDQVQIVFPSTSLVFRILLLAKALLAAWVLHVLLKKKGVVYKDISSRFKIGFIFNVLKVFYLFLGISIITNIIGLVYPAIVLCDTVFNSIISLIILTLVVLTLSWTSAVLLRTKFFRRSNYINNHWRFVEKRTATVIYIIAIYLWVKSILKSLSIYDGIEEWLSGIFQTTWSIGENTTIEFGGILWFFIVILLTVFLYRIIKTILEEELYPRVKLPRGVPGAISMIVGYVIVAYGIFLALVSAGVNLSQFGLIVGALGVGIGFGLQNIVANFIAGLVLAFERPIQVGDTIEAGTVMGDVTAIGVRACTIRTFDGSEVMVPNGNLIGNDVINWTLSDRKKRRDIYVSVAYGNNPHEVVEVLRKAAEAHPNVLQVPAPWILFEGFGESALNFRVRIWSAMDVGMTTKSDVAMNIYDALMEAGIQIPFPQQDLHIKSIDPAVEQAFNSEPPKMKKK